MPTKIRANYENKAICSECGGKCCKNGPGEIFPDDLGDNPDAVMAKAMEMVKTGDYCFDWWEGDPTGGDLNQVFYLRAAVVTHRRIAFHPGWGGPCVFLGEGGCRLPHDERPTSCRDLEPREDECIMHGGSKPGCAIAWIPYQDRISAFEAEVGRDN